jgi:hypothetical protein
MHPESWLAGHSHAVRVRRMRGDVLLLLPCAECRARPHAALCSRAPTRPHHSHAAAHTLHACVNKHTQAAAAAAQGQGVLQAFQDAYRKQLTSVIAFTGTAMLPGLNAGA